eukprot:1981651-Lingulodinium_polyedra.AAC.1
MKITSVDVRISLPGPEGMWIARRHRIGAVALSSGLHGVLVELPHCCKDIVPCDCTSVHLSRQ